MDRPRAVVRVGPQLMGQMMDEEKFFRVLGLPLGATTAAIRAAYLAKIKQYHPDCNCDPGARAAFQEVQDAYRTLCDRPPAQVAGFEPLLRDEDPVDPGPEAAIDEPEGPDAAPLVREVMASENLVILFDGFSRSAPDRAAATAGTRSRRGSTDRPTGPSTDSATP